MQQQDQLEPTKELAEDAIRQAKSLLAAEIDLAKADLRRAAAGATRSAIAFGVAGIATLAGVEALVLSIAVAGRRARPARSAALGLGLLGLAAAAALVGRASLPGSPLKAVERIASDVEDVTRRAAA